MTRKNSKKLRKFLTLFCCAALLVCMTIAGTVAYLTSTDTVENTFTVGDAVAITLDEAKTAEDGTPVTPAVRTDKNTYKLMPGHTYTKDPTVHVTGEECYVFVKVENGISRIEADSTIADQMTAKGWKVVDASKGLYVYATGMDTKTAVSGSEETPADLVVFSTFTVKTDADHDELEVVKDAKITINAYAVQKDGFESSTPTQIWNATFGASTAADGE